jgi:flagellar biosynthetic protein FliR
LAAMEEMAHYTGRSLAIAVELSAPALLALFLVDVSFAMLAKVASGVNVHNESQPVKALFGLAVVLLALGYTLNRLPDHFAAMLQELQNFLRHVQ